MKRPATTVGPIHHGALEFPPKSRLVAAKDPAKPLVQFQIPLTGCADRCMHCLAGAYLASCSRSAGHALRRCSESRRSTACSPKKQSTQYQVRAVSDPHAQRRSRTRQAGIEQVASVAFILAAEKTALAQIIQNGADRTQRNARRGRNVAVRLVDKLRLAQQRENHPERGRARGRDRLTRGQSQSLDLVSRSPADHEYILTRHMKVHVPGQIDKLQSSTLPFPHTSGRFARLQHHE
jgi:hypothetical protein